MNKIIRTLNVMLFFFH